MCLATIQKATLELLYRRRDNTRLSYMVGHWSFRLVLVLVRRLVRLFGRNVCAALLDGRLDLPYGPLELDLELRQVQGLSHLLAVGLRQQHGLAVWVPSAVRLGEGVGAIDQIVSGIRCRLGSGWERVFLLGVHPVDDGRRCQGKQIIAEEELDVLPAGERPPVRPGAVDEVKEGEVGNPEPGGVSARGRLEWAILGDGLHRKEGNGRADGHADKAPNQATLVEGLPLGRQGSQDLGHLVHGKQALGVHDLDLLTALQLPLLPALRQRRHRLEAPFLVGDAAQQLVAVADDGFLPALLFLLPARPGARGLGLNPVRPRLFSCGRRVESLRVEKSTSRRDGEEIEAHGIGAQEALTASAASLWCLRVMGSAGRKKPWSQASQPQVRGGGIKERNPAVSTSGSRSRGYGSASCTLAFGVSTAIFDRWWQNDERVPSFAKIGKLAGISQASAAWMVTQRAGLVGR